MSKFYLPTQKGSELFPTTVVAPPVMRWVGVDARTAEAQAIIDTFGSAITAFHMQQAHNHSLSVNTQSRGFMQISPNLGVEYVNQGGLEYITIYAQPIKAQVVEEEKAEQPVIAAPCWYPTNESKGSVVPSEELAFYDLPVITQSGVLWEEPTVATSTPVVDGTVSLNFSEPLLICGESCTEIGLLGSAPVIWLGAACVTRGSSITIPGFECYSALNPAGVATLGFDLSGYRPPSSYDASADGFYRQVVAQVSLARGSFPIDSAGGLRKYVVLRWVIQDTQGRRVDPGELPPSIYSYEYEITIVEALRRPGRPPCPALVGFARLKYDGFDSESGLQNLNTVNLSVAVRQADWNISGYLASTYNISQFSPGQVLLNPPYPPAHFSTGSQLLDPDYPYVYAADDSTSILRTWIALDPNTGAATSLSPDFRWGDSLATPWPPGKEFAATYNF